MQNGSSSHIVQDFDILVNNFNREKELQGVQSVSLVNVFQNNVFDIINMYYPETQLSENIDVKCGICLEFLKKGEYVRTLDCDHTFHINCIDYWIIKHKKCSNCRHKCF